MSEESKLESPPQEAPDSADTEETAADGDVEGTAPTASSKAKKKKSKGKSKATTATTAEDGDDAGESSSKSMLKEPVGKLSKNMIEQVVKSNPSLGADFQNMDPKKIQQLLKGMKLEDIMTGMSGGGKNAKDMANYKFWQTQPVARFDEDIKEEGEIKKGVLELVPTEPSPLLDSFEWVVMDLADEKQLDEVYELLTHHYVEDDEAMFRFNYSGAFLNWALKSPGWRKDWHIGVRVRASQKLVAFISGIPVDLRVRSKTLKCSEINFLCVHKKLRSKRLAPVLIKEITRRCHLVEIWQAIYTAGVVLPKPVSSCRYYHRSLDWQKLNEVGFSPMPSGSSKARQITKYALPKETSIAGLRAMELKDVPAVKDLLTRYLSRFDMAPIYSEAEVEHWFLHKRDDAEGSEGANAEQVIWTYVVQDPTSNKITDFFSFYNLESSVIKNTKHDTIRAAYMFYYATEAAFAEDKNKEETRAGLKKRLNELIHDALILAKRFNFDVFNALTLLDNNLFLADQKFGAGDGQLHYYLYNYRTAPIAGGIDEKSYLDEKTGSGIGMVML